MVNIKPNPDYDLSHIKLEETPKPKTYQQLYIEEHNKLMSGPKTWIEWVKDDSQLNLEQKLGFMFKAGYEVALEKVRKADPQPTPPLVEKPSTLAAFKKVIRHRWRTILVVALLTTAFNWFVPLYTYHVNERNGWTRLNRVTGQIEVYYQGHWQ